MKVQVVQPYSNTDKAKVGKNFRFILSKKLDFHMVINPSVPDIPSRYVC